MILTDEKLQKINNLAAWHGSIEVIPIKIREYELIKREYATEYDLKR